MARKHRKPRRRTARQQAATRKLVLWNKRHHARKMRILRARARANRR